jgi:hypothetical protein
MARDQRPGIGGWPGKLVKEGSRVNCDRRALRNTARQVFRSLDRAIGGGTCSLFKRSGNCHCGKVTGFLDSARNDVFRVPPETDPWSRRIRRKSRPSTLLGRSATDFSKSRGSGQLSSRSFKLQNNLASE